MIGELIGLLIRALVESGDSKPAPRTSAPSDSGLKRARTAEEREAERQRKFQEALGLPATGGGNDPLRPRTNETMREKKPEPERKLPRERPIPPIAVPPLTRRWNTPSNPPPPLPSRPAYPPIERPVSRPTPPLPELPELEVNPYREFRTVTSRVRADASEGSPADFPTGPRPPRGTPAEDWQAFLSSPGSLRSAMVLREILGPPRGLPTATERL